MTEVPEFEAMIMSGGITFVLTATYRINTWGWHADIETANPSGGDARPWETWREDVGHLDAYKSPNECLSAAAEFVLARHIAPKRG